MIGCLRYTGTHGVHTKNNIIEYDGLSAKSQSYCAVVTMSSGSQNDPSSSASLYNYIYISQFKDGHPTINRAPNPRCVMAVDLYVPPPVQSSSQIQTFQANFENSASWN